MVEAVYTRLDLRTYDGSNVRDCLGYWEELRGERQFPSWSEFEWMRVPPKLIPFFGVVDITPEPSDFIYRFWGTGHVRAQDAEYTGMSASLMEPREVGLNIFDQYRETYEARQPLLFRHVFRESDLHIAMEEISLRLPFSGDGETVDKIVAFSDIRKSISDAEEFFKAHAGEKIFRSAF